MHQDQIGNLVLVTSGGNRVDDQTFYAYGKIRSGGIGVERSFTGQQKDFGTGLIYFNARYYDPDLGTFISPDTVVPDPTNLFAYNRYMYVAGNPLRLTDSSGHVWETVVDAVSVGYGIYDIYQNGLNWENGTSLAVDVVSTAVPFMPAPGACVRWCDDAVQYGDDAWQWGKNKADDAWRWATGKGDEVADGAKSVDNIPCPNSFSGDTLVMTAGGAKPIAELVEGDIVLAYNEATGKVGPYPIVDTISHVDPTIVLLTIDGELIETTAEHPFYEMEGAPWLVMGQTEGRWTDALDLRAGDRVWKADGTSGVVQSVAVAPVPQRMYNLTVAEAHTFFVGDGQWLVHNCENLVKLVEQDGDIVELLAKGANGDITIITQMTKEGDQLILNGLHMDGPGAGKSGISE